MKILRTYKSHCYEQHRPALPCLLSVALPRWEEANANLLTHLSLSKWLSPAACSFCPGVVLLPYLQKSKSTFTTVSPKGKEFL